MHLCFFSIRFFPYEKTAALLKWNSVGEVLITGVYGEGDINKTDGCKQAMALADLI
jgi:hypothetical protein